MSSNIVRFEPDPHVAVQMLLPWYLTGRLPAGEREEVESHLAGCATCRAELETERQWRQIQPAQGAQADVEEGWAKMRARLGAGGAEGSAGAGEAHAGAPGIHVPGASAAGQRVPGKAPGLRAWRPGAPRPAAAPGARGGLAVPAGAARGWGVPALLSVALLLAIGWTLRPAPPQAPSVYHALAAPALDAGTAVVRFRADATEAQIRASLNASGARLVDGPTVTDAYVVRLPHERYAAALAALRGQPAVALVEALQPANPP
jgi:hypothetical protein